MKNPVIYPRPGDKRIIAPQVAVQLLDLENSLDQIDFTTGKGNLCWYVIGQDVSGNLVDRSQQIFCFSYFVTIGNEWTVITGLVKSDLNQLGLAGARVAILGEHSQTATSIVATEFNGEYIVIALTIDGHGDTIEFPIKITFTKEGFKPTVVKQADERVSGLITRDLVMIADFDRDGIKDAAENASACLDADDADTDDDGIADGEEDTNFNCIRESKETDPCESDTDRDGIQDGTERGYTVSVIGPDTDTAIFQPDLDPTTTSNPLDDDSDNDGLSDGEEDLNHNGRVDAGETEPGFPNARALPAIIPLLIGD